MKTLNSLSGGQSSSYMAVHFPADYELFSVVCIDEPQCRPKDKSLVYYANAKLEKYVMQYGEFIATAEDDLTLVAMRDLEQFIGKEIIWVRGPSYDDVIDKPLTGKENPTRLPSSMRRYCTQEMKIFPIFYWWLFNHGEKIKMRIGFRFDEYIRMENFMNRHTGEIRMPVSCSTGGKRLQKFQTFPWRHCSFPLVQNAITKKDVNDYWKNNGWIHGDLFEQRRQIKFPVISNCIGCFHKSPEILATMAILQPEKMNWFSKQENKNMGRWLDKNITYDEIIKTKDQLSKEILYEYLHAGQSCTSEGCSD